VYLAFLDADQGSGRYGGTVDLVVRCKDNSTELYINWKSYLGMDTTSITHRIDKEKAISTSWLVSTDHKSAFMRSPVATLKRMVGGQSFIANVTPYGESPVTAVFDIKGADAALRDVRKGCGW
jgi:type VI secretion system protein VasI